MMATNRQKLFERMIAQQTAALKKAIRCEDLGDCPDCGLPGFNLKTGKCAKPSQCCGQYAD
jgi:hypothetical protein